MGGSGEYPTLPFKGYNVISPLQNSSPCIAPPPFYYTSINGTIIPVTPRSPKPNPDIYTRSRSHPVTQILISGKKHENVRDEHMCTPWIIPAFAAIHLLAFILTMSRNKCDTASNGACVMVFLKRLSFQSLAENPLLGPSAMSLLDFGALESELVTKAGEGWRMIITITLHAGVFHLAGNLVGLLVIGLQLEKEFGFLKVVLIYLMAGFSGALLSALFVRGRVSVGASGALMGLLGSRLSEIMINWNSSEHCTRSIILISFFLFSNLVFGLMPLMDNFTIIGGTVTGLLLGSVLLTRPQFKWVNQQCFPAVIYDVDDLPTRPKQSLPKRCVGCVSPHSCGRLCCCLLCTLHRCRCQGGLRLVSLYDMSPNSLMVMFRQSRCVYKYCKAERLFKSTLSELSHARATYQRLEFNCSRTHYYLR